jgi:hypothetical protein
MAAFKATKRGHGRTASEYRLGLALDSFSETRLNRRPLDDIGGNTNLVGEHVLHSDYIDQVKASGRVRVN